MIGIFSIHKVSDVRVPSCCKWEVNEVTRGMKDKYSINYIIKLKDVLS